jgi:high-affinity iron transporter
LQPRPRSFRDPAVTAALSPVRAFSAISDGVAGTAMAGFASMPEADRWSLAFYVTGIHHDPALSDRGRRIVDANPALAALDYTTLADLRDVDLEEHVRAAAVPTTDQPAALAFLRTVAPFQARGSVADVRKALAAAKTAYASGDATGARHALTDAYLDGFEPLEARLLVSAPELVRRIEDQFLALREGAEHGMESARFAADVDTLLVQLEAVEVRLRGATSPWSATLAAFVVVVREGVESVLLVMLLLGLAKRAGAETDRRAVHVGWGAAIAAGVITWFASAAVVALGGGNRELVEGIVALLAVVVLLYAGHFVLARMDSERRIAALKRRFSSIPAGRRRLLLFTFSFVAAYREAFEVVLFLRAILLGAPGAGGHVAIGSMLGLGACIAVFVITARVGKRLNASLLLNISGGLLCVLAFVLAGKGVRSLQEAGLVGVSAFDGPRSDLLGVFPTWQTLGAQAVVIVLVLVLAFVVPRRSESRPQPARTEVT